ncbi:MAG: TonB-dependent receptor [Rhodanobacteraceae bacterium]
MNKNAFFSCLLACLAPLAQAQSSAGQHVSEQPEMVVTATGVVQTVDNSLADVSVIDRSAIEASGAADVYEVLQLQAGVDIVRSGGPGTQTNVFLRGTNSNHVLVLIDGVRAASLNTGAFAWEQLPLDVVERIEIVRGPRAAIWGSDAIGGVIQIFTRKLDGGAAAVRLGSGADSSASAGVGHWQGREGFTINAGIRHVRGFSSQNPQGFSYNPDDDGERNRNLSARGAVDIGSQTLSGSGMLSDSAVEFDQGVSHNIEQTVGVRLAGPLGHGWSHQLMLGHAREDLSTPAYATRFRSRRQSLGWRNRVALGRQQYLVAGIDLLHERGASMDTSSGTTSYGGSRDNQAVYASWHGTRGHMDWQLAGRHDHNSAFGNANTGSAALGFSISRDWRLSGSWGQGFRGPNLNEQFSPGYGGYYAGNPLLKPERSHSAETGLEWTPSSAFSMRFGHYRTDISQLISFTHGELFQAENIARARIDGSELALSWQHGPWHGRANATWQKARNLEADTRLLRRPDRKANLVLGRRFSTTLNGGVEWQAVSPRPELGGELPGYSLLNARINWQLARGLNVHLRAQNLMDRDYSVLRGFNTAGRSFWIKLVWRGQ